MSRIERKTKETQIVADLSLGAGKIEVRTGDTFLDHMVTTLATYAGIGLSVEATGDLRHHLVEDVAIVLGVALRDALPERAERYGWTVLPMDEALVEAAVDVGGRAYYEGRLPSALYEHFLRSFAMNLGATLHVRVVRGRDRHHIVEAAVKATGLSLRQALRVGEKVFSTKGAVAMTVEGERGGAAKGASRAPGRRKSASRPGKGKRR